MEADDIIATATRQAIEMDPDVSVLIVSSDKDLLQLVSDRVRVKSIMTGLIAGPDEVRSKFKVGPTQMRDYLCLVGDASDNVIGAKGIGAKHAATLLTAHGSIAAIYDLMSQGMVAGMGTGIRTSLTEFKDRWPTVAKLIALKTDAEIPFSEIASERTAPPIEETEAMSEKCDGNHGGPRCADPECWNDDRELNQNETLSALGAAVEPIDMDAAKQRAVNGLSDTVPAGPERAVRRYVETLPVSSGPVDFSQQLEPRNMQEAVVLADRMFQSKLFMSAFGAPQAVLAVILAGRELGFQAMASLRAFHVIDGKPTPSADTLAALVMKSGKAKYFRCTERTATRATFVTQRLPIEDYPEQTLSFTIEEAKAAWRKDQKAWDASGWGKTPAAMLVARAKSALARLEYPDVVGNLYGFEEME
jgi:hypothetical protein